LESATHLTALRYVHQQCATDISVAVATEIFTTRQRRLYCERGTHDIGLATSDGGGDSLMR
jgi:hypothetical protein